MLHRRVQRRAPGAVVVGVGAPVQQEQRHLFVQAVDRHEQRSRVGLGDEPRAGVRVAADAFWRGIVDVGARGQQQPGGVEVALLGGEQQGGELVGGTCLDRGAELDQDARDRGVVLCHRQHQGRLSQRGFGGVRVGSRSQEEPNDIHTAHVGGGHQRGLAVAACRVDVGTCREQGLDNGDAAVDTGQRQGGHAVVVVDVHVGAGRNQLRDQVGRIAMRGPVQRGRAIAVAGVRVDIVREQRTDRDRIGSPRGGDQLEARGRGLGADGADERRGQEPYREHNGHRAACSHRVCPHLTGGVP